MNEKEKSKDTNRKCCNCDHYDTDGYCFLLGSSYNTGYPVSPRGCCNHFSEKYTPQNSGYSSPSCFLTSACVDYYGKTDDCYELETLRRMRDEHLVVMDGGKELISQYYKIAPQIVEKINNSEKRDKYYEFIYEVIQNCISCFEEDKKAEAVEKYKNMVSFFLKEFEMEDVR